VSNLVVQREVLDARVDCLARLCAEADNAEARLVYLLCELVDGDVGGGADERLALVLLGEVVDDGGGGDRLARAGGALHYRERLLQHRLDRKDLRVVKLWQPRSAEAPRQVDTHRRLLHLVAEQPVVDVAGHRGFVDSEGTQRSLHPIVGDGLPDHVDGEAVDQVDGRGGARLEFDADLLRGGEADDGAGGLPGFVRGVASVAEEEVVARDEAELILGLGEGEVGDALLVETNVPPHRDVLLRLGLLHVLVVVGLQLDQRPHDVLVLVGVLVAKLHGGGFRVGEDAVTTEGVVDARVWVCTPQLLKAIDLSNVDRARTRRLGVGRLLDEPLHQLLLLHERGPFSEVPVVLGVVHLDVAGEEHDKVLLDRDETELEDILGAGEEALQGDLAERRFLVEHDLVVLAADQVVDDARGGKAGGLVVAEPLASRDTLDDRGWGVEVGVGAGPVRELDRGRILLGLVVLDEIERGRASLRRARVHARVCVCPLVVLEPGVWIRVMLTHGTVVDSENVVAGEIALGVLILLDKKVVRLGL